jgi:hypothetical protein
VDACCRRSNCCDCHRTHTRSRPFDAKSSSSVAGGRLQLDWFYFGINGGFGTGSSNWSDGPVGATGSFPIFGYLIGGMVGVNYQIGEYVFGIEGDGTGPTFVAIPVLLVELSLRS